LTIDVLSSEPITFLVKVNAGGPEAAAPVTHNGDGTWQTLSFTFNTSLDNKAANPTGTYAGFVIHAYWEVGRTQFFTPTVVPKPARTFYVDNIREPAPVGPPVNDVTGDVYINDGSFAAGDFTTAAGQDIATNDGSAAEPFATLDYVLSRSTQGPGDVIYIDAGTYSWTSTHALTDSGTLANPITIQGKGNNETNITTTASSTTSAGLHFTTGEHWVVKDLNWTSTAARAVWVAGVDGITIDNCTINMTSASSSLQSIIIGTAGGELTIKNATLTRSNTAFHMIEVVEGTTLIMQDNTVSFPALISSGIVSNVQIRTNASSLFIIERNKFVNGGYGIGNVVGTVGPIDASSIVKNNFFNGTWGIVTTIVQGLKVHNNSFNTTRECIYGVGSGNLTNWDIQNNIFYTATSRTNILSGSSTSHPAVMDYNLYYSPNSGAGRTTLGGPILSFTQWQTAAGGPWEQNGIGGNAASFDPLYVNPANGDLHLSAGSPAIGAGTDVGITDDIDGDARPLSGTFDMGADEYVAPVISTDDATLSDLQVDGVSIPGFSPATIDYTVVANSASSIPQITLATPTSSAATSVVITQADSVFEDATVVVTAEDGVTTETYTIRIGLVTPDIIQDFEPPATYSALTGDNGTVATIVSSPGGVSGNSLELESTAGGATFQAGFFDQVSDFVVLTPENNTVQVDVYASQAFNLRLKLETGGTPIERTVSYTDINTWQTLTYDFGAVNATYSRIVFFLNSNATNNGFLTSQDFTAFVDNIALSSLQTERLTYTYQNDVAEWTPENPVGVSTSLDNVSVVDGTASVSANLTANDLQIASGATLNVTSSGILNIARNITNDGDLVFQSDLAGAGQLGAFSGTVSGTGEETVERFIPARRAFRMLTSAVNGGSIFDNWQEEGNSPAGLGTHITGSAIVNPADEGNFDPTTGFDFTTTGAPSMFTFDNEVENQTPAVVWNAIPNTNATNLFAGTPYRILIRGDRNISLSTNSPTPNMTTLRAKGSLQTGLVNHTFTHPGNVVFVGNPYQSVVNLNTIDYTGVVDNEFAVWDPNMGDSGTFVIVTTGSGVSDPSSSAANQFLQPGQAFFLRTEAAGPHSITFNESSKATGEPQTEVFSTTNIPYLNMRLYETERFNTGGKEQDAAGLRLHDENSIGQFSNAMKLQNASENLSFIANSNLTSIQHALLPTETTNFPIFLNNHQHENYTFRIQMEDLPTSTTAYLKDEYTDELIELNTGINTIPFQVDAAIQESLSTSRFSIQLELETFSDTDFDEVAFEFYPNPTEGLLTVNLGTAQATNTNVRVYDLTGRSLMQSNFTTNESSIQIDISQLDSGIYLVEVEEGNKKFTSKILKR